MSKHEDIIIGVYWDDRVSGWNLSRPSLQRSVLEIAKSTLEVHPVLDDICWDRQAIADCCVLLRSPAQERWT